MKKGYSVFGFVLFIALLAFITIPILDNIGNSKDAKNKEIIEILRDDISIHLAQNNIGTNNYYGLCNVSDPTSAVHQLLIRGYRIDDGIFVNRRIRKTNDIYCLDSANPLVKNYLLFFKIRGKEGNQYWCTDAINSPKEYIFDIGEDEGKDKIFFSGPDDGIVTIHDDGFGRSGCADLE